MSDTADDDYHEYEKITGLKAFLSHSLEGVQEALSTSREYLDLERLSDTPNQDDIYMYAGIVFVQEQLESVLKDKIDTLVFLSDDDVHQMLPEIQFDLNEGETLYDIDLIEEEYSLPENYYHDHIKYYEYIEGEIWKELQAPCGDINKQLDFFTKSNIARGMGAPQFEIFERSGVSELDNLYDQVRLNFEDHYHEIGAFRSVAEGVEQIRDQLLYAREDILDRVKDVSGASDHLEEISLLAGNFIAAVGMSGAIVNFQEAINEGEIQYVRDEDLAQYFPNLTEQEFSQLDWAARMEVLYPLKKCPSAPESIGYVAKALMQDFKNEVESKVSLQEFKTIAIKEFGLAPDTQFDDAAFRKGLDQGYIEFSSFDLEDSQGNDISTSGQGFDVSHEKEEWDAYTPDTDIGEHPAAEDADTFLANMEGMLRGHFPDLEQQKNQYNPPDDALYKDLFPDGELTLREKIREQIEQKYAEIADYTNAEQEGPVFDLDTLAQDFGFIATMNYMLSEASKALREREEIYQTQDMMPGEYHGFVSSLCDKIWTDVSSAQHLNHLKGTMLTPPHIFQDREEIYTFPLDDNYFALGAINAAGFLTKERDLAAIDPEGPSTGRGFDLPPDDAPAF